MKTVNDIQKPSLDDDLTHYGVKGMKWGVRRSESELARSSGRFKRDSKTGIRPIAKSLDKSKFGKSSKRNVERHLARKARQNKKGKKQLQIY